MAKTSYTWAAARLGPRGRWSVALRPALLVTVPEVPFVTEAAPIS